MNLRPTNDNESSNANESNNGNEYIFQGFKIIDVPYNEGQTKKSKRSIYNPDEDIWPGYDKWASDEEEYNGPGYSWMTDEEKMELYGYTGNKDYKKMDYKEITYITYNEIKEIKSILLDIKEVLSKRGE